MLILRLGSEQPLAGKERVMLQKDLPAITDTLLNRMTDEGYSQQMLEKNRWILGLFGHYCDMAGITDISISSASDFIREHFGFDLFNPAIPLQSAIRYPLLALFEFEKNGNCHKKHTKPNSTDIPGCYEMLFQEYSVYIKGLETKKGTYQKKRLIFAKLTSYLYNNGILDMPSVKREDIYGFIESMDGYAPKSLKGYKAHTRILLDWLHEKGYVPFSGWDALPVIHDEPKSRLMSYYSKDEVARILSSIDTGSRQGKFAYCTTCFFAYLGMRAGDVIRLKFSDIDWGKGQIHFTQHKTGYPLTLPLLDEVRYPLIDYIRNARYESCDKEHIFIRLRAPHTAYPDGAVLFNVVRDCIDKAGVDTGGRHRGPHALRHSLATNLMAGDVPVSGISDILGHASTLTTEIYLTIDERHLKEISLEVPNA